MELYPWVVLVHAACVLLFFIAHGASMAVAFRVKGEQDPVRLRALLDLSRAAMSAPISALAAIGLVAGIVAGFMGGWWDQLWIWISLVLLLAVAGAMTPFMAVRLNAIRAAAGQPTGRDRTVMPAEDLDALRRLQEAWNPIPLAIAGLASFLVILYLMIAKPF